MGQKKTQFEWHMGKDEASWPALPALSQREGRSRAKSIEEHQFTLTWRLAALAVFLCALGVGGWLWHTANTGLEQIEAEIDNAVNADLWPETHTPAKVQLLDLAGDVAVVQVALSTTKDHPAYRQTRVYQRTEAGWLRAAPTAALWGVPRRLETKYFVFHYYDQDSEAVKAAAARLDALYPTLYAAFFPGTPGGKVLLPPSAWVDNAFFPGAPEGEELVVHVDPAQPPRKGAQRATTQDPFVVASPAAYLAPVEISQADLLAQSLVLALLDDLSMQIIRRHILSPDPRVRRSDEQRLWQLLGSLRLHLLWATGLPLAAWREPVVQWVYSDVHNPQDRGAVVPAFLPALCAQHQLWLTSPLAVQIPLLCDTPDRQVRYLAWRLFYPPPVQLAQLAIPAGADAAPSLQGVTDEAGRSPHPATAVALATMVEYAAAAYGPERILALVASLPHYAGWDTLIPAVFGVPAAAFEAGWQAHLEARYGAVIQAP
jgi:hypothetical protein